MSRQAFNEFQVFQLTVHDFEENRHNDESMTSGHAFGVRLVLQASTAITHSAQLPCQLLLFGYGNPNVYHVWNFLVGCYLNTRNILRRRRKHLDEGYNCVLYPDNIEESAMHLFFECSTSTTGWFLLGVHISEAYSDETAAVHSLLHGTFFW